MARSSHLQQKTIAAERWNKSPKTARGVVASQRSVGLMQYLKYFKDEKWRENDPGSLYDLRE